MRQAHLLISGHLYSRVPLFIPSRAYVTSSCYRHMSLAHVTGTCHGLMSRAYVMGLLIGSGHRLMSWALRGIYSHPAVYLHSPPFLPRLLEGLYHPAHNCVYHKVSVTGSCPCFALEFLSRVQSWVLITGSCHGFLSRVLVTGSCHGFLSRVLVTGSCHGFLSRVLVTGSCHRFLSRVHVTGERHWL